MLIVDDDRDMCAMLEAALGRMGFVVESTVDPREAPARVLSGDFDVVLADFNMPVFSGVELCQQLVAARSDVPVVVVTGFGSLESAVAAIRAGAYDFVTKPFEIADLAIILERAARDRALKKELSNLRRTVKNGQRFEQMIGTSSPMRKVYDLVERVAQTDAAVLIMGESGTGKELVARAVHSRSARASGPFVAVNCAAMPEPLLESELFGHVKGAFTDARKSRPGLFTKASGGTFFLDEVGEMPLGMQSKLLRALQERTVRPVGGDEEIPFDARIVTATNRDLELEVEHHRFREDLFYRINVVQIAVPPLRSRGSDVLLLAQHYLERYASAAGRRIKSFTPQAASMLLSHSWPGNVRELQNCIERAVALALMDVITGENLPDTLRAAAATPTPDEAEPAELGPFEAVERSYIERVMQATDGSSKAAAKILGFDRRTLDRKLAGYVKADAAAKAGTPLPKPAPDPESDDPA